MNAKPTKTKILKLKRSHRAKRPTAMPPFEKPQEVREATESEMEAMRLAAKRKAEDEKLLADIHKRQERRDAAGVVAAAFQESLGKENKDTDGRAKDVCARDVQALMRSRRYALLTLEDVGPDETKVRIALNGVSSVDDDAVLGAALLKVATKCQAQAFERKLNSRYAEATGQTIADTNKTMLKASKDALLSADAD